MPRHPDEINPEHPVTQAANSQWHKICALILLKLKQTEVSFTEPEIHELCSAPEGTNIVLIDANNTLTVRVVDNKTAHLLAHS